jgi:hypothetical protein
MWIFRDLQLMLIFIGNCGWRWKVDLTSWPLRVPPVCCLRIGIACIPVQSLESLAVLLKMTRLSPSIIVNVEVHLAWPIQ